MAQELDEKVYCDPQEVNQAARRIFDHFKSNTNSATQWEKLSEFLLSVYGGDLLNRLNDCTDVIASLEAELRASREQYRKQCRLSSEQNIQLVNLLKENSKLKSGVYNLDQRCIKDSLVETESHVPEGDVVPSTTQPSLHTQTESLQRGRGTIRGTNREIVTSPMRDGRKDGKHKGPVEKKAAGIQYVFRVGSASEPRAISNQQERQNSFLTTPESETRNTALKKAVSHTECCATNRKQSLPVDFKNGMTRHCSA